MHFIKAILACSVAATTLFSSPLSANAADKVELIYSDTVAEGDIRTQLLRKEFGECLGDGFDFKSYHGATLFKQGTELTAMQRGNLDMANLAIFDFYNQVPHTKVLGVPFMFRSYDHMRAVYDSDVLDELKKEIEDKAQVKIIGFGYIGARHLGYKGDKQIMTPEELKGVKIRMPPGEGWQQVGAAMGATTVPIPFTEVYTALQTGAIDGQDNGFPATRAMKFDEVINHIGKTAHLMAANEFAISKAKWDSLTPEQQAKIQSCADNFVKVSSDLALQQEVDLEKDMIAKGMDVYTPDLAAFQAEALKYYEENGLSADWPEGLMDKIQAVGK